MKKLLVLALVLGVAGLASAGLQMNKTANDTSVLSGINFTSTAAFAGAYVAFVGVPADCTVNYGGNKVTVADMTADLAAAFAGMYPGMIDVPSQVMWFDFADTNAPPVPANGNLVTMKASAPVTVYVLDAADASVVGSPITLVPEPVTMLLLGLGGLFIRRK